MKTAKFIFSTALAALMAMAPCPADAAAPRAEIEVNADHIRLGDIFTDAGEHADRVITNAPAPGGRMVLDVYALYQVATAFELDWKPVSHYDQTVVRRSATTVETRTIKNAIKAALARNDIDGSFDVEMNNRSLQITLPGNMPGTVKVLDTHYDTATDQFRATIQAPAEGGDKSVRMELTGRVARMVEIPVLAGKLTSGDIIGPHDIEWIEVRADDVRKRTIMTEKELIGMTPRRAALPGKPLKSRDVTPPILVKRGELVTLRVKTARLSLTARAKAMTDGAEGEVIRAINTKSNKIIEGTVTGPREVTVAPASSIGIN